MKHVPAAQVSEVRDIRIKVAGTMRFIIDFAFLSLGAAMRRNTGPDPGGNLPGQKKKARHNGRARDFKMLRYQDCDPYQSSICFLA